MKIGFDTSFLVRPPSGIGTYVESLRTWMPQVRPDLALVEIGPPEFWAPDRLGTRVSRFAWEYGGSGTAARRTDVDLLHMPMMAVPVTFRGPVVTTIHDVIPFVMPEYRSSRAQRINLAVARRMVRRAEAIITPSRHAAADVAAIFDIPRDRVWVTHEAADARYAPLRERDLIQPVLDRLGVRGPFIFNIGGLDVRKNVPVLIRAFHEIMPEIDNAIQLVIGGAPHSENPTVFPPVEPLVRELGISDRVVMTGRITEDDKVALMRGAAVYATPSIYEGFGLSALEAMACGVPVIAANRTSFPEIICDAGLLVEPRIEPVAAALRSLLTDDSLAADLGARGLERARAFHWRRTAEETVEVYDQVLNRQSRQG